MSASPGRAVSDAPLRIVFLTHNFPRFPGDVSGAFLATLAGALMARGHHVRVLAPSDCGEVGEPELEGVPVTRVRYAAPDQETIAYRGTMQDAIRHPAGWRALVGLWRALRKAAGREIGRGADLVHAHWWIPGGLAAPGGVPLVLTIHGTDGAILRRSALARWVAAPVFRRAAVVTAVSRSLADDVGRATGRTIPDSHVQPMPVDVSHFDTWSVGGGGLVVLSRLTAQKRVDLALRAFALLRQGGSRLPLTIVGGGPEEEPLRRLAAELALHDAVRFAGAVPPGQVPERLRTADCMLFPARQEGFGLVAAEALMCGVPVVACSDGGGVRDILPQEPGGAGALAAPEPAALAQAVRTVMDHPRRLDQARRLGAEWRRRLAPASAAAACEAWYREALDA